MRDAKNSTRKTTNSTWAIHAAVPAIPANPNRAASNAIIRKVNDQLNITGPFSYGFKMRLEKVSGPRIHTKRFVSEPFYLQSPLATPGRFFIARMSRSFHTHSLTVFSFNCLNSG